MNGSIQPVEAIFRDKTDTREAPKKENREENTAEVDFRAVFLKKFMERK